MRASCVAGASGWATPTRAAPKIVVEGVEGRLGLVRADSRDSLGLGVEARINRSRSPAVRGKEVID